MPQQRQNVPSGRGKFLLAVGTFLEAFQKHPEGAEEGKLGGSAGLAGLAA